VKATLAWRVVRVRTGGSQLEAQARAAQQERQAGTAVEVRRMNNELVAVVCPGGRVYAAERTIPPRCQCCEAVLNEET
jgi:hypothetical protein